MTWNGDMISNKQAQTIRELRSQLSSVQKELEELMVLRGPHMAKAWDDGYKARSDDLVDSLFDPRQNHPKRQNPWR